MNDERIRISARSSPASKQGRQPYQSGQLPGGRELVAMAEAHDMFKVRRNAGITALNYAYVSGEADQFDWPRSEMRGLTVDEATGEVLARPFQKFWNFNEDGARRTDWTEAHVVLPKLDGSLVYPSGDRWTTRGGVTDTSARAEALAKEIGAPLEALLAKVRTDPTDGARCTPCFEYIGPNNQIVIRYRKDELVLLAVRRIDDGQYWPYSRLRDVYEHNVDEHGQHRSLHAVQMIRTSEGSTSKTYLQVLAKKVQGWPATVEGVVVAFEPSGHRIKIKTLEYMALHRARDDYSTESRVLEVWSNGNAKKLLDNLGAERAARLGAYYEAFETAIRTTAETAATEASETWREAAGDRKKAALLWITRTGDQAAVRALGFTMFNAIQREKDPATEGMGHIRIAIERSCRRQSAIEEKVIPLLGSDPPRWAPNDGNVKDADE